MTLEVDGTPAVERRRKRPTTRAIPERPSVRSANQEREALPGASDQEGTLSIARRRKW